MNEHTGEHLGQGIAYEARLPLAWQALDAKPDERQLTSINEANEAILRTVASLEDFVLEHTDESGGLNQEIARLDVKLNLLLDLVGQLLAERSIFPAKVPVSLGSEAAEWGGADLPREGQYVQIELYLHPSYPRPLRLLGPVRSGSGRVGAPGVMVNFEGMAEPVRDALERLIFRHHRRHIAQTRRPRS